MTPVQRTIDPLVQAIFDALNAFMSDQDLPSCNAYVTNSGAGINEGVNGSRADGSTITLTYYTPGTRVVVTPTTAALGPGETQQFTAAATDASGSDIAGATFTWKTPAGSLGSIDATGLYTAPATIAANFTATVQATLSDGTAWTTVSISLHP